MFFRTYKVDSFLKVQLDTNLKPSGTQPEGQEFKPVSLN